MNKLTVISGGNTGADMAALLVAKKFSDQIIIDGYAPLNYWTDTGSNLKLRDVYGLKEIQTKGYVDKEIKNVDLCDCIIGFRTRQEKTGRGTEMTINYALNGKYKHISLDQKNDVAIYEEKVIKPAIVFWDLVEKNIDEYSKILLEFLNKHNPKAIMITGPCESTYPCEKNVSQLLEKTLKAFLL